MPKKKFTDFWLNGTSVLKALYLVIEFCKNSIIYLTVYIIYHTKICTLYYLSMRVNQCQEKQKFAHLHCFPLYQLLHT